MERKIGEVFEHNGEWYQCVGGTCRNCSFYYDTVCKNITIIGSTNFGNCHCSLRTDHKSVIFKKLEKIEESPCKSCYFGMVQLYKLPYWNNGMVEPAGCHFTGDGYVLIEIKQNKEDMEEKKLNLKPFDLQKAREGKPVCTRNGRRARIICFDRKFYHDGYNYPIVAMVNDNDNELVHPYTQDGLLVGNMEDELDLMMLPEKKEGWAKVRKDINLYDTKEEADRKMIGNDEYVTAKVCWEE
jgi:hypothetical protein